MHDKVHKKGITQLITFVSRHLVQEQIYDDKMSFIDCAMRTRLIEMRLTAFISHEDDG